VNLWIFWQILFKWHKDIGMASAVAPLASLLQQLDARISALEKSAGVKVALTESSASAGVAEEGLSKLAEEFDSLIQKFGVAFKDVCDRIGGDAVAIGASVMKLWILNRSVIDMAGKSKKWEDAVSLWCCGRKTFHLHWMFSGCFVCCIG
jgi:hypothetical protein